MRALKKVAAAVSLLLASAIAEQSFIDSVNFASRSLHQLAEPHDAILYHADEPDKEFTAEYPEYTKTFANGPSSHGIDSRDPNWELSELSLVGLIVGGGCTFIFLIFALVNIIIDEAQRQKDFTNKVEQAMETLKEEYNVEEKEMSEILEEFEIKDAKGDQFDAEAERAELAAIN